MGASYYVAIHEADWPSIASMNECLAGLNYPVRIEMPDMETLPLRDRDGSLKVQLEDKSVELEASIIQMSSTSAFAYGLKLENGKTADTATINDFVPLDLNAELRKIGADAPGFQYGDYVLTMTFRSSVDEWKAGFLLMSGLIRCSNGLGFEFDQPSYGGVSFADQLVSDAADMK